MIIKLSDYILEQSISEAEVNDIEIQKDLAEIEVLNCLCEYQFKLMNMNIYVESDEPQNKSDDENQCCSCNLRRCILFRLLYKDAR